MILFDANSGEHTFNCTGIWDRRNIVILMTEYEIWQGEGERSPFKAESSSNVHEDLCRYALMNVYNRMA